MYDITHFLEGHPGGEEIILQFGGKDISIVMNDPAEHAHSDSAFDILDEYLIGTLESADNPQEEKNIAAKKMFIDPHKPMLSQIWNSGYSKAFYLEQVHIPRHVPFSAPLFGPAYLEVFSKTPWYVIPMFWTPIITYCFMQASANISTLECVIGAGIGLFFWTLIEYSLHRFVFHIQDNLPDHPLALSLHFVLHGIHHFLPMDG